jgi:hypothetical protein
MFLNVLEDLKICARHVLLQDEHNAVVSDRDLKTLDHEIVHKGELLVAHLFNGA